MELVQVNGNGATLKAQAQSYSLLKADADAVRVMWPTVIRPGLVKIKKKDPQSGHWLPEHVRAAIENGLAGRFFCECHLIIKASSSRPCGFMVLRLFNDEFVQVPLALFLWMAHSTEPRAVDYILKSNFLERRAREIGVNRVEGVSSRPGWGRRIAKYGYRPHQVIYRKELS